MKLKLFTLAASVFLAVGLLPQVAQSVKQILSFGGNGMIGSEVLTRLIAEDEEYNITLVSRGSWHFDSGVRVMPYVNAIVCDRNRDAPCAGLTDCDINTIHYCEDLWRLINETEHFHAVLDFSGYEPKWIHDAIFALEKKTRVYIYISSDSVYDVCQPKSTDRPSVETDAVRPHNIQKRKALIEAERYGDAKLSGEEALRNQREEDDGGFPWVALRFSDVVGPRDTTYRWQIYQLWIKLYHDIGIPIFVPSSIKNVKESLTYVDDAAQAVILAMNKPEAWDNAYNIAFEQEFYLWDILQLMAKSLDVEGIEQDNEESEKSVHLFPTVFSGPQDITKAKEKLGFVPSDPVKAFKDTVTWYDEAFVNMEREREEMITRFMVHVLPRESKDAFYLAVGKELEKHGIILEKYRKKRKGDLGEVGMEGEEPEHQEL